MPFISRLISISFRRTWPRARSRPQGTDTRPQKRKKGGDAGISSLKKPKRTDRYGTVNGRRPSVGKRPVGVVTVEGCERKR